MAYIHVLNKDVAAQIAAGEVVTRPSSVIKELVENSIDANSTSISVDIVDGGKKLMRISDNGIGIHKSDIPIAFLRHSTSKISTAEDLDRIHTMGFRGEALYSIAAVSKIQLTSKTKDSETGTKVDVLAGRINNIDYVGCPKGTIIEIHELFYNTPARLKFLKKTVTESGYIGSVIASMILSHPSISFRFTNNGKQIYFSSGDGNLKNAIFSVYGKQITAAMVKIDTQIDGMHLSGYIGRPSISRSQNKYGSFFVNRRYIESPLVKSAIKQAYSTALMVGKNPIYILNLEISPDTFDVNVHPNKLQVRFLNERGIYSFILSSVRERIFDIQSEPVEMVFSKKADESKPNIDSEILISKDIISNKDDDKDANTVSTKKVFAIDKINKLNDDILHASGSSGYDYRAKLEYQSSISSSNVLNNNTGLNIEITDSTPNINVFDNESIKIIGQLFDTYILIEKADELLMMDQHAAHERYIYHKLMENIKNNEVISQQLLIPQIIEVTYSDSGVLNDNITIMESLGFSIEEYGKLSYRINAVPYILGQIQPKEVVFDIISELSKGEDDIILRREKIIKISCVKAVKAGDRLSDEEILHLITIIKDEKIPLTCPHGRPFVVKITKRDIEKNFKRIQ